MAETPEPRSPRPAQPPGEPDLRVKPPKESAAGLPAALVTIRRAVSGMGPVRTLRTLARINQVGGFDCPGCAWPEPDPDKRKHIEFCENGAKAVAEEATAERVDRAFFAEHPVSELAGWTEFQLGKSGRLTEPMWLAPGASHYVPVTWADAFDLIAEELAGLASPDAAAFYTSGRTSNEAAFCYQLFVRAFGTNNLPDCSNLCHESSGTALTEAIGVGKGTVTLEDIVDAELIVILGQNPGTNHPRMLSTLQEAKKHGARIVAINPLREAGLLRFRDPQRVSGWLGPGVDLADHYLQIRVNGDLALFQAFGRMLIDAEEQGRPVIDRDFVESHCEGFEGWADHLRRLDWSAIDRATGLTRDEISEVFELLCRYDRIVVCWAMGLTQHKNSVPTIREIVNVLLARGAIGRRGAGVCPVRGHSNVQGDRTMGIWERPTDSFLDALGSEFGFEPPRHHGFDVVDTIKAMVDGKIEVFIAVGGNFAAASPDTSVTEDALHRCRLTVHVSTKLNRSHVVTGRQALILPCLGRTEEDRTGDKVHQVTVEDSMGSVQLSRGRLRPASHELKSEVAIVCGLAERVLGRRVPVDWSTLAADYDLIRDHIQNVVPGFDNFNETVRRPGGFLLPHPVRDRREFPTQSGRARFTANRLEIVDVPDGYLLMQTVRSHDQYNTTIYGFDDRYRGISGGRRVVLVHEDDARALGFPEGTMVDIVGVYGGIERRVSGFRLVTYPTARGCCATYFPEANELVPLDSTAEGSNTPTSKSVVVRLMQSESVSQPA
ncbi:MAG TPA: FdhF/YdeP family oxidoreductase [Acidimicrobiales bacterium]|nr:FdhF/YdeP family oxidoreductase [Acidimicrobiales bacterium]